MLNLIMGCKTHRWLNYIIKTLTVHEIGKSGYFIISGIILCQKGSSVKGLK